MDGKSLDAKTINSAPKADDSHHSMVSDAWNWTESNVVAPFVNSVAVEPLNATVVNLAKIGAMPFGKQVDYISPMSVNTHRSGVETAVQAVSGGLGTALVFAGSIKLGNAALGKAAGQFAEDSAFAKLASNPLTSQIAFPTMYEGLKQPAQGESRVGNMITTGTAFGVFGLGGKLTSDMSGASLYGTRAAIGAGGMMGARLLGDWYDHRTPTKEEMLTAGLTGGIINTVVPALVERGTARVSSESESDPGPKVFGAGINDSVEKPPNIAVGDDGTMYIMTRDGAAASFYKGEWHPGLLFDSRDMINYSPVTDAAQRDTLMAQASGALQKFLDQHKS